MRRLSNLTQNMGLRYVIFRTLFALRARTGLLKRRFPRAPVPVSFVSLAEWRENARPFFFKNREELVIPKIQHADLAERFEDYRKSIFSFFNGSKISLGHRYDWVTNPDSGFRYDPNKHWTEIPDYDAAAGDIKFVWEKSRFSFLGDLMRYDYHFGKDCAADVLGEITSWINANPINCGPNYKCSQEISLRTLNWIFALYYYQSSPVLTETLFAKILHVIYWQMKHVWANIRFSRISVRNNHALTETLTLYLVGMLFPEFPESQRWKIHGKKWFEEEIAYQVYEDGTFLQFSMNYHRVVVQLLTWALRLAEVNGETLAPVVKQRAEGSLHFLFACMNAADGRLPNYGANDGALFFRLSSTDFRDFRPQLEALAQVLGTSLEGAEGFGEDAKWYGLAGNFRKIPVKRGLLSFPKGGYYLIRETETLTFLRCGNHRDRPGQADNLHLDIWHRGENILPDGGSYKYNTDPETLRYFMGTASHNTVQLGGADQMRKGRRFIWYYWTQLAETPVLREEADRFVFTGAIRAFQHVKKGIVHRRTVTKKKGETVWEVEDEMMNAPPEVPLHQLWHLNSGNRLEILPQNQSLKSEETTCAISDYYGVLRKAVLIRISGKVEKIRTRLQFREQSGLL